MSIETDVRKLLAMLPSGLFKELTYRMDMHKNLSPHTSQSAQALEVASYMTRRDRLGDVRDCIFQVAPAFKRFESEPAIEQALEIARAITMDMHFSVEAASRDKRFSPYLAPNLTPAQLKWEIAELAVATGNIDYIRSNYLQAPEGY